MLVDKMVLFKKNKSIKIQYCPFYDMNCMKSLDFQSYFDLISQWPLANGSFILLFLIRAHVERKVPKYG